MFFEGGEVAAFGDVVIAEGAGAFEEGLVDAIDGVDDVAEEFLFLHEGFFVGGLVAACEADFALLEVAGADFDADGDAFFDPLPFFDTATEVAGVDFDAEVFTGVFLLAKAGGEGFAGVDDGIT